MLSHFVPDFNGCQGFSAEPLSCQHLPPAGFRLKQQRDQSLLIPKDNPAFIFPCNTSGIIFFLTARHKDLIHRKNFSILILQLHRKRDRTAGGGKPTFYRRLLRSPPNGFCTRHLLFFYCSPRHFTTSHSYGLSRTYVLLKLYKHLFGISSGSFCNRVTVQPAELLRNHSSSNTPAVTFCALL